MLAAEIDFERGTGRLLVYWMLSSGKRKFGPSSLAFITIRLLVYSMEIELVRTSWFDITFEKQTDILTASALNGHVLAVWLAE